ncbi:hypothetical protein GQ54DRAFT_119614 [Martensiomyces pterosporus]|nr:hypothetical protein GQ54DRAFT_119614 [Martensiomyces pterosporus]
MSSALVSPSRAADTTAGKSAGTAVGVGKSSPERMLQRQQTPVLEDGQALVPKSEGAKRKHSVIITTSSGEFDLNDLPPPRPGRPSGKTPQDPAMQEARKRARVLRNRAAAQLSREKKRQHLELLEAENADLRAKNAELERRLGKAEGANLDLSAKLDNLAKQLQDFQNLILGTHRLASVLATRRSLLPTPPHPQPLHLPPKCPHPPRPHPQLPSQSQQQQSLRLRRFSRVGIGAEQSASALDDILRLVVDPVPKWRMDQQTPAFAHSAWDFGVSSSTDR